MYQKPHSWHAKDRPKHNQYNHQETKHNNKEETGKCRHQNDLFEMGSTDTSIES